MTSTSTPSNLPDLTEVSASRYIPVEVIGMGGMGIVYKVQDRGLNNEPVALKLLNKNLLPDPLYVSRFRREVAVARQLSHPNIVKIFDFGELKSGGYFFTMELVNGLDLRRFIRERGNTIPFTDVLKIFVQILLAVEHAHSCGIIHRDIKAENVLLTPETMRVRLSDFSSAREIAVDLGLTPEGCMFGTPHYMAPECLSETKATQQSDIYSMGILFYELLAGKTPFESDAITSIFAKHLTEPVPHISHVRSDIPAWCQEIIETCAEKDPSLRYESVSELLYELLEYVFQDGLPLQVACVPESVMRLARESRTQRFGWLRRIMTIP